MCNLFMMSPLMTVSIYYVLVLVSACIFLTDVINIKVTKRCISVEDLSNHFSDFLYHI